MGPALTYNKPTVKKMDKLVQKKKVIVSFRPVYRQLSSIFIVARLNALTQSIISSRRFRASDDLEPALSLGLSAGLEFSRPLASSTPRRVRPFVCGYILFDRQVSRPLLPVLATFSFYSRPPPSAHLLDNKTPSENLIAEPCVNLRAVIFKSLTTSRLLYGQTETLLCATVCVCVCRIGRFVVKKKSYSSKQ